MADYHSSQSIIKKCAHLPALMLVIGYIVYWIELFFLNTFNGVTSSLAWVLWGAVSVFCLLSAREEIKKAASHCLDELRRVEPFYRWCLIAGGGFIIAILGMVCFVSALPPHLVQEYDALNYHYTLPRQHLILGSFSHLSWSSADLFLLPIQFALSPYWFATIIPNKIPQLIFVIGLIFIVWHLASTLTRTTFLAQCLVVLSLFGLHAVGIQLGTAMLDLVICYLFLAAIHSFLSGYYFLSAVELTFFLWSKSFVPLQILLIVLSLALILFVFKKCSFNWRLCFDQEVYLVNKKVFRMFVACVLFLSVLVGGPFVVKSMYYAGTPLFPFKPGMVSFNQRLEENSTYWQSLRATAEDHLQTKDEYGYGRSVIAFIRHFWLLAVPERGVNNRFDYPLGLPYLLFVGPFIFYFFQSLRRQIIPVLPLVIVLYWLSWWMGSQQARFLYIPLILMFILTASIVPIQRSKIFWMALVVAIILNSVSIFRAHRQDFVWKAREQYLRPKDQDVLLVNKNYLQSGRKDVIYRDDYDLAFAQFPFQPRHEKLPFVIQVN